MPRCVCLARVGSLCSAAVEAPSVGLALTLERCGFPIKRLTTGTLRSCERYPVLLVGACCGRSWSGVVGRRWSGTPPRIDSRTIDYTNLEIQPSDDPPVAFSYMNDLTHIPNMGKLVNCHVTHTHKATHDLIKRHMDQLPTFEVTSPCMANHLCLEYAHPVVASLVPFMLV